MSRFADRKGRSYHDLVYGPSSSSSILLILVMADPRCDNSRHYLAHPSNRFHTTARSIEPCWGKEKILKLFLLRNALHSLLVKPLTMLRGSAAFQHMHACATLP